MSAPVLSWLFSAQGKARKPLLPVHSGRARFRRPPEASGSSCSDQVCRTGSLRPALRAIPFPEVTELFCRLPSATLLYRLEAANLGDLMRLWVRTRVRINDSRGFSWTVATTPDPPRRGGLFLLVNPISGQADFRVRQAVKQKRKHFPEIAPASPRAFVLPLIIHASMMEY